MNPWHRVTGLLVPACALLLGAGCAAEAPRVQARPRQVLPAPDLCVELDRKAVTAALHGPVKRCEKSAGPEVFTVVFTGTARLSSGRAPARLTISYYARRDAGTGADLWEAVKRTGDDRVSVLGIGEAAVFEAGAEPRPQLLAVKGELVIMVGLAVTGRDVPQVRLPDHLLEIGRRAFTAAG